jgi:hypothetical protein
LPDGRPDFQGVWSYGTLTPLERPKEFADKPFLTDEEAPEFVQRQLAAANADAQPTANYNEFWFERPRFRSSAGRTESDVANH